MNFRRKFAIVAIPAVLALGASAIAVHASSPNPTRPHAGQDAAGPAEATGPETPAAVEKPQAPEAPGTADVGHADPGGAVDNQSAGND